MHYFCTKFNQGYLPRGLALYQSLKQHSPAFTLYALCLDQPTYAIVSALDLEHLRPIALADLEQADPEFAQSQQNRSRMEYYLTCTPVLMQHLLQSEPAIDLLTYLDSDTYIFADPTPALAELANASIGITAHRPAPAAEYILQYGRYNIAWISARADVHGRACIGWWRERCIEWCYDRLEGERYADQKYLDQWEERFERVAVISHKGVNVAPWNIMNYTFQRGDTMLLVDDQPLIMFHFQNFEQKSKWLYDTATAAYGAIPSPFLIRHVFMPYLRAITAQEGAYPPPDVALEQPAADAPPEAVATSPTETVGRQSPLARIIHYLQGLLRRQYILVAPR